jgi:20S proteasome alpha/beta subunit
MGPSRWYACCLALCLAAIFFPSGHASTSNNYNAYNYDMTTPQFTPDGRLLQVEYASSAADLSCPLIALQLSSSEDDTTLVLMTLRTSNTQNRMVLFDNNYCIAMSGVLCDSVALLQVVLQQASQHLRLYKKPLTILQVAIAVADACQKNAFGGGIRPYGSTMLVCGYNNNNDSNKEATIYQTDPSGGILQAPSPPADSSSSAPIIRWIVGGNPTLQRQLRRRIDSNLSRRKKTDRDSIADTVALVARTLIKETQKNSSKSSTNHQDAPSLEVVVLSPTLGCHRLTKDQLDAIAERMG